MNQCLPSYAVFALQIHSKQLNQFLIHVRDRMPFMILCAVHDGQVFSNDALWQNVLFTSFATITQS
jgi:hypothetical protein